MWKSVSILQALSTCVASLQRLRLNKKYRTAIQKEVWLSFRESDIASEKYNSKRGTVSLLQYRDNAKGVKAHHLYNDFNLVIVVLV